MVGHDLERELEALLDEQAVPQELTVEEASSRLASLLGTAPVSRRRKADDSVPAEAKPEFVPPPKVALAITADLFPAPEPEPPAVITAPEPDPDPAPPPAPPPPSDPDRTRIVALEAYAAMTATSAPEGATRVVNLQSLAATSAIREVDSPDEERTMVVRAPVSDEERTKVIEVRALEQTDPEDTLDFERPRQVPRDFGEEPDQDTFVRSRPPTGRVPVPAPPSRADREDADADEDALTPPPVDAVTGTIDLRDHRSTTSSGSIDLNDLVAELERDIAPPVPVRTRSEGGDLGRSLGGEALDAEGLIADLGAFDHRRPSSPPPDGPFLDLASFADPPSSYPRRPERAESLDATLAALEAGDEAEERTSYDRPASHPAARGGRVGTESVDISTDDDDDDGIEIEIEVDE